jgi:hypothetical protein
MGTAAEIGSKMATSEIIMGKLKGDAVLGPIANTVTGAIYAELQRRDNLRDAFMLGNLPFTVTEHTTPEVSVCQPFPATVDDNPVVGVVVDVHLRETTKEYGLLDHRRHVTVYLERQRDTSEGTWRASALKTTKDKVTEIN